MTDRVPLEQVIDREPEVIIDDKREQTAGADKTNSAVQIARGATANTVTGGFKIAGGFFCIPQYNFIF